MSDDLLYTNPAKKSTLQEIAKFRNRNIELNEEISTALSQPDKKRWVIKDGVFDYEGYLNSKIKILWILKEPYDTDGGGWHISQSQMYARKEFGAARTTWYPIVYSSHAILNEFQMWNEITKISKDNIEVANVLSHIAYINVQKLPSLTREKSSNSVINQAFTQNKIFFEKQFNLLNPDIIIGGNTLWMMFEHFGLKGELLQKQPTPNSYIVKGKLFINAKHPSQRGNRESYVNNIVTAAKEWESWRKKSD